MTNMIGNQGKNSESIQQQNRLLVLRLIRKYKVTSRVMLSRYTGLKQATITNIVNELINLDYVKETGLIEGDNGRRVKGIMLNDEKMRILTARFTSDYYAVGVFDLYGKCIRVEKKFWEKGSKFQKKLEILKAEFLLCKAQESQDKQILGAGIVLQGMVTDIEPEFQVTITEDLETYLSRYFTDALELQVYVDNMSNMSAYYEWNKQVSEEKEIRTLVCLMVGYSVDCALIFDGKVVQGRNGRSGHFGHVSIDMNGPQCECGNRGCIKNYISVDAVKKRLVDLKCDFQNTTLNENSNIREVIQAYYDGDELAKTLYEELAEKLGVVVANLMNQFNPETIMLGDEIPNNDSFEKMVKEKVKQRMPKNRFDRAEIKVFKETRKTENDVGMKGMSLFVINERLKSMKLE